VEQTRSFSYSLCPYQDIDFIFPNGIRPTMGPGIDVGMLSVTPVLS
jgi:hypothetical protein